MRESQGRGTIAALGLALALGAAWSGAPRAEPTEAEGLRIVVNTSARKLYVYEDGKRTRTYTVAVGKKGHRTPTGRYAISRVVWNPWWHPPNRPWARGKKVTPPGPGNPMGRVKMYFREMYYIHGTPEKGSLGRAVSHGCVRMANADAIALARLVHQYGGGASSSTIDRLVRNSRTTREIWLKRRIPVHIVSRTAAVEDGRLELYGWGGEAGAEELWRDALAALEEAGYDLTALDREALWSLVLRSEGALVTAHVASLVASSDATPGLARVS